MNKWDSRTFQKQDPYQTNPHKTEYHANRSWYWHDSVLKALIENCETGIQKRHIQSFVHPYAEKWQHEGHWEKLCNRSFSVSNKMQYVPGGPTPDNLIDLKVPHLTVNFTSVFEGCINYVQPNVTQKSSSVNKTLLRMWLPSTLRMLFQKIISPRTRFLIVQLRIFTSQLTVPMLCKQ